MFSSVILLIQVCLLFKLQKQTTPLQFVTVLLLYVMNVWLIIAHWETT